MKAFSLFRKIGMWEGISFLVLLFIAMPMKYLGDMPMAVTIVGGLHGALFVAFLALAYFVKEQYSKNFGWIAKALAASIIPFGTFVMDKQWKQEESKLMR